MRPVLLLLPLRQTGKVCFVIRSLVRLFIRLFTRPLARLFAYSLIRFAVGQKANAALPAEAKQNVANDYDKRRNDLANYCCHKQTNTGTHTQIHKHTHSCTPTQTIKHFWRFSSFGFALFAYAWRMLNRWVSCSLPNPQKKGSGIKFGRGEDLGGNT